MKRAADWQGCPGVMHLPKARLHPGMVALAQAPVNGLGAEAGVRAGGRRLFTACGGSRIV